MKTVALSSRTSTFIVKKLTLYIFMFITLLMMKNVCAEAAFTEKSINYNEVTSGSLYLKNNDGYAFQLAQNSEYRVEINGLMARVNVTQTFENNSDDWVEAVYVFPLAEKSAVDSMVMKIGERRIVGKIKEKKLAKKIYQQAKKSGKTASLVSQQRPNMFTSKVANIAPHQQVKVIISYLQTIDFNHNEFSVRLPLTITPRYIPKSDKHIENYSAPEEEYANEFAEEKHVPMLSINSQHGWALNNISVPDANKITPPQTRTSASQQTSISVSINAGLPIETVHSKFHPIVQHKNDQEVQLVLVENTVPMDRDFELRWQLKKGVNPSAAFFKSSDERFDYGLLMLMPPKSNTRKVIEKDITYIIDTSGSMGGVSIAQAKLALKYAVENLNENDNFNIIAFSDQSRPLFQQSESANKSNISWAVQWIAQLQAGGGTEMYSALNLALENKNESQRHQQVIFITDGAVGNEQALFSLIEDKLNDTRLHTVGIGSAPNGYFMAKSAEVGRGTYRYIGDINQVQQQMRQLFDDVNQTMLRNINIQWPSRDVEMFPARVPDLYAGSPVIISAKWPKGTTGRISVSGELSDQAWQQEVSIT